jgi:hypothetical protein
MLLATPHFAHMSNPNSARIEAIVTGLSYVDEDTKKVSRSDFDYLIQLAYFQIRLATALVFTTTDTQTRLTKELYSDSDHADLARVVKALEVNQDVMNLVQLYSVDPRKTLERPSEMSSPTRRPTTTRVLNPQASDVMSAVSFNESNVQGMVDQHRASQVIEGSHHAESSVILGNGKESQASMINPSAMRGQSQLKPGDTTTIDLMSSYEGQKAVFQEDTIKRMSQKLKAVRLANEGLLDPEYEVKLQYFIQTLELIETSHADFYA